MELIDDAVFAREGDDGSPKEKPAFDLDGMREKGEASAEDAAG